MGKRIYDLEELEQLNDNDYLLVDREGNQKAQKLKVSTMLENKVDKEEGKGLSTNDFTNEEKEKLAGLSNYDDAAIKKEMGENTESRHTHNNKDVLDEITSERVAKWDESEGGSTIEIVDNLSSTDVDKALSANMGRYLNSSLRNLMQQSYQRLLSIISTPVDDITLTSGADFQLGEKATLTLNLSKESATNKRFFCYLSFTSGETATNLNYASTPIIWHGDDCGSDGTFVPQPNTTYEVCVKYVNSSIDGEPIIVARVGIV